MNTLKFGWLRLRWECARLGLPAFRRLGWGGLVGALGLVLAVGLGIGSVRMALQHGELTQTLADVRRTMDAGDAPIDLGPEARLDAFYEYLLPQDDIPGVIRQLITLAEKQRVVLRSGEYRAEPETIGGFLSYRITLPVKGRAPAVQGFVLEALQHHRTLALKSVLFKRERIEAQIVEARIQFVLLTRSSAKAQYVAGTGR